MKRMRTWAAALLAVMMPFAAMAEEGSQFQGSEQVTADASRPWEIATNAIPGFGSYVYDGAGNITSIGDSQAKDIFTYDNFGRLQTAAVRNAPAQTYTYDQWGNIRTITTNDGTAVQKLGVKAETNQITEAFDEFGQPNNVVGMYDGRGNLTSYNSGSMAYDGVEMMKESTVDGVRRFYIYSASDERVVTIRRVGSTNVGSDWTIRDADGRVLRRLTESGGNLQWTSDYVYRGGQLLATAVPGPAKVRHFHLDHLGTPRLITGNGGVQLAQHDYQPFGRELASSTNDGEKAKFTGHERDADTLDYMHARYYDPYIGRFLSVDPVLESGKALLDPQRWNRYGYVLNNPIRHTDSTGRVVEIDAASNVDRLKAILTETMRRPTGRADVMAVINDTNHKLRVTSGRLNSPAQVLMSMKTTGKALMTFGRTQAEGKRQLDANGKSQLVVSGSTMTIDTNAVSQHHPDSSGTTTGAHEFKHVNDLRAGGVAQMLAGDVPTSATGPAEQHGQTVAAEKPDLTQKQARQLVDQLIPVKP